jgi:DNA-binding beta-propeller fold protein YncE
VDAGGTVYVAEAGNHCIRKITPAGVVTTLAGDITTHSPGAADGTGAAARFNAPRGLALDPDGNLLVADLNNHCLRKVTPAGVVTTLVGDITTHLSGSTDGTGAAARLAGPNGVAVASDGTIYVAEGTQRIRKVTPAGATSRFAGSNTGAQDGLGIAAKFNQPASIAIDRNDVLYVAEFSNHLIRQIKPSGLVTTIAGDISTHTAGFADGIGPTVRLFGPVGIVCGRDGTLYVGDSGNNRIRMM